MLIAAIDTSSIAGSVALRDGERLIGHLTVGVGLTHSEGLMPALDALLRLAGKSVREITAVACVTGPGSYTGLRVGAATAQGIAYANQIPCLAFTPFEVLAWAVPRTAALVCPLLPARKGWLYAQCFKWNGDAPAPESEELYVEPAELLKHINEPAILFGPGLPPHRETLRGMLEDDFLELPEAFDAPRADILAGLAWRKLNEGGGIPPHQLIPRYLGPSQAEINWKKRMERGLAK